MSTGAQSFTLRPRLKLWTDGTNWTNWSRHEECLRAQPKWKPHQIASVAEESLRIISKTTPIGRSQFQCRGLVVGYVQSGKTANFTAVAARAADVGYRLIIVLSGIHDSLRNQTQRRLNRELVEEGNDWITLTDEATDFHEPVVADGFAATGTVLVVAKKITPILKRLNHWLSKLKGRLGDVPVLLIDDEADQASINTRGNRRDPSVDKECPPDEDTAPSLTNALIREILGNCPRATYIAYTATPFANILIDPDANDTLVGQDLFPKDFVVQLPRPDGYTGTEELFGVSTLGRDVLRPVVDADVAALKPRRRKRGEAMVAHGPLDLPQSLCDAMLTFALVGAIRLLRGQTGPHTMLVHVSEVQRDQQRIGDAISEQIREWFRHESAESGVLRGMMTSALRGIGTVGLPAAEIVVLDEAVTNLARMVVVVLNSTTGGELEYEEKPGRQLVAVGGNRLSRGLTLEGLTVAYFLRTTTLADALLQMARWYGFRTGYDDLIRIWTTNGIAQWFVELALVEESLRDAITALNNAGHRPDKMAIRMRAHSELLLTSKSKSKMLAKDARSWSGGNPQTILFPLHDAGALERNLELGSRFLRQHPPTHDAHGGALAYDVSADDIALFLRSYEGHANSIAFRGPEMANWVMQCAKVGDLVTWTVFVASPKRDRQVLLGGKPYGLVRRSLTANESIGILIDPRHEGVDLHGGAQNYRSGTGFSARAMRKDRPPTQGLLLMYPLDPEPLRAPTQAVLAVALSLPQTSDEGRSYVLNRGIRHG